MDKDNDNETILNYFSSSPFKSLIEIYGVDLVLGEITPLIVASIDGNIQIVDLLCRRCNVNKITSTTALHMAVYCGNTECTKFLLYHNANPDVKDIDDDTPLHIAVWKKDYITTEFLLRYGADPDAKNKLQKSPLDLSDNTSREILLDYKKHKLQLSPSDCITQEMEQLRL